MTTLIRQPACHARHERAGIAIRESKSREHEQLTFIRILKYYLPIPYQIADICLFNVLEVEKFRYESYI
jgi:hypothetical protein